MPEIKLGEIVQRLRQAERILVTSHISPDGDAVGAVLAVYHIIRALHDREVVCSLALPCRNGTRGCRERTHLSARRMRAP